MHVIWTHLLYIHVHGQMYMHMLTHALKVSKGAECESENPAGGDSLGDLTGKPNSLSSLSERPTIDRFVPHCMMRLWEVGDW